MTRPLRQAIEQFRRAADRVPFYRRLLSQRGVRAARVVSLETFQTLVPIISKHDVFASNSLPDLLIDRSFASVDTLISSSGSSAKGFSLGMLTRRETRSLVRSTDRLLDDWFETSRKRTFVINTLAMGVKIPTSLPGIDLSVRSDKVIVIVERLRTLFQQFIVTSDVFFLKKLLEDGVAAGTNWVRLHAHFGIGGEWFPESYRQYLASLLRIDLYDRRPPLLILSSMGAAELGFHLCHESQDTVRLRQLTESDPKLREALFGSVDTAPMIGHYNPSRWYVELMPSAGIDGTAGALVFTTLDRRAVMPLVRYQTGDCGHLLSHGHVAEVLRDFNYAAYVPRLTQPLMAVAGRTGQSLTTGGKSIRTEFIRSVLYSDYVVAAQTTGQFQVTTTGARFMIQVQLRSGVPAQRAATVQRRFTQLINRHVPADIHLLPYFEFRHGMGVDYEKKFDHLVR